MTIYKEYNINFTQGFSNVRICVTGVVYSELKFIVKSSTYEDAAHTKPITNNHLGTVCLFAIAASDLAKAVNTLITSKMTTKLNEVYGVGNWSEV